MLELKSIEEMTAYVEAKFTSPLYKATAEPQDAFGPSVKYIITWTPVAPQTDSIVGPMWVSPYGYTAAVPFTK